MSNARSTPPEATSNAPAPGAPVSADTGGGRRRRILVGVGVLVALGVGVLAYWFFFMRGIVYTDDARIGGHMVDVAPEVNGTLVSVAVHEGQYVHKGEVVFRLDPAIPQAALNQAEAALKSARADVAANQAYYERAVNGNRPEQIKAAEATYKGLLTQEELARIDFARARQMFKGDSISQDTLDRARTAYESARQARDNAEQNLILLQRGSRAEDIAAAKAALELSQSKVKEAEAAVEGTTAALARYTVKAPFSGWVVRRWLQEGAMPLPAQPVVSLFDPASLRVDANVEEQDLSGVQVGDEADISIDAYPSLHLTGRVTRIMRAVNSEFSLIPSEGVAGTFIKVTQRVPIELSVVVPPDLPIGPGLSVEVHIHSDTATAGRKQDSGA
ncbi:multidrug export protein EmrA [mine drainage metagenome]|uniref:Multidrug export protein EmrA n=1 Tax=mine drainage metagenome TaxID=410659 RepID=A0A1J5SYI9_9ZZZZ